VLTPAHITDLFCDLANVNSNDVIYDPCCGTGGFLIAGMKRMFELAGNDEDKKQQIKNKQLVGIELRPSMFTYTCSNMMMRGDGKSNIYCGDCFALSNMIVDSHKPTVAFLNPPYDVGTAGQMLFIEHALNMVSAQNGTVVAIVQMSCAIKNEKELIAVKKRILDKHHLKSVLSMPDELFNPHSSVVTCIMVFEANKKHEERKTWFGYFKDDGFEKRKQKGRIDARGKWNDIRKRWKNAYINFDEIAGLSVKQEVKGEDEWCAEAYMETDYSKLCDNDFIKKMKDYAAFRLLHNNDLSIIFELTPFSNKKCSLNTENWKWFRYDEIFEIKKGKRLTKEDQIEGTINYIGATDSNNGVTAKISNDKHLHIGNTITVSYNGSIAEAYYQTESYWATDDVNGLYPKFKLNTYIAMFLCTLIYKEKYRFNYGRKWDKEEMQQSKIKLPITPNGTPDWQFMEDYIKSLPYSKAI